jgi:hypothetical protein
MLTTFAAINIPAATRDIIINNLNNINQQHSAGEQLTPAAWNILLERPREFLSRLMARTIITYLGRASNDYYLSRLMARTNYIKKLTKKVYSIQ